MDAYIVGLFPAIGIGLCFIIIVLVSYIPMWKHITTFQKWVLTATLLLPIGVTSDLMYECLTLSFVPPISAPKIVPLDGWYALHLMYPQEQTTGIKP